MLPSSKQLTVYLLEDNRLDGPDAKIQYYPACHAAQLNFSSDESLFNPDDSEYKPAILLIKGADDTVISRTTLGVPSARIDTAYLDENKNHIIYLFTKDYSTGMGSYNGPIVISCSFQIQVW